MFLHWFYTAVLLDNQIIPIFSCLSQKNNQEKVCLYFKKKKMFLLTNYQIFVNNLYFSFL